MCKPSPHNSKEDNHDEPMTISKMKESDSFQSNTRLRMTKNFTQRASLAAFACLQNALVGGLVFGWASIDRTLLTASREQGGAALTPVQTTIIFSWASCVAMLSSLIMGLVLDKYGPRFASVLSNILIGLGCQLFSLANSFEVFALATCMMAFGGPGISSSIVHIANLFPRNQFLVMSCLCGSITFSFSILAVFGDLWEAYGIGFRTLFGMYVALVAASATGSFFLWPDSPFEHEDSDEHYISGNVDLDDNCDEEQHLLMHHHPDVSPEQEYVEATLCHHQLAEQPLNSGLREHLTYGRTESYLQSAEAMHTGNTTAVSLKDQPFRNQILSQTYLRNLLIFVTTSFFVNFTIASMSTELADQQVFSLDTQHDLSRSFTLIMSGGLVASIMVGVLMDRVGLEACSILTLVLGQTSLLLRIFGQSYPVMLIGYVCYTLFRQFLFPVFIAYLTGRLGFKYFGILSGVGFALSGVAQIFMASLVHILEGDCHMQSDPIYGSIPCNHGEWSSFHLVQIILLVMLTFIPITDLREAVKEQHRTGPVGHDTAKSHDTTFAMDNSESSGNSAIPAHNAALPAAIMEQPFAAGSYGSV